MEKNANLYFVIKGCFVYDIHLRNRCILFGGKMKMMTLLIICAIACMIALVSTIYIGMNQRDETYVKSTKKRIILLSSFYIITFVPAIFLTAIWIFFR